MPFFFLQGVETLSLRVDRHVENTKKVIEYLSKHPLVEKINHPSLDDRYKELYNKYFPNGAGSIFTFDIKERKQMLRNSLIILKFSLFLQMLLMLNLLLFIRKQQRILSFPKQNLKSRTSMITRLGFQSVQSI